MRAVVRARVVVHALYDPSLQRPVGPTVSSVSKIKRQVLDVDLVLDKQVKELELVAGAAALLRVPEAYAELELPRSGTLRLCMGRGGRVRNA